MCNFLAFNRHGTLSSLLKHALESSTQHKCCVLSFVPETCLIPMLLRLFKDVIGCMSVPSKVVYFLKYLTRVRQHFRESEQLSLILSDRRTEEVTINVFFLC